MWIMFSCLISCQSRISCQFHVRKIRILLIFSWVNDFRKNINKSNIKWFARSCSTICCSFVLWPNLLYLASLYLPRSCLVLVTYNKTNIPCLFCLISKLFTLGNIIFNSALRSWILITSGEWFLILNKKAWNICLLSLTPLLSSYYCFYNYFCHCYHDSSYFRYHYYFYC